MKTKKNQTKRNREKNSPSALYEMSSKLEN